MTNGANDNSPVNEVNTDNVPSRQITVTVSRPKAAVSSVKKESPNKPQKKAQQTTAKKADSLNDKRLAIYHAQQARQQSPVDAPFPIEKCRDNFIELVRFQTAIDLDRRGIQEMDALYTGFDHLYVIDDLIKEIKSNLPTHTDYGWEATSRVRNYLNLPTVGVLPKTIDELEDNRSIMCYVLTHFGVASYTNDRAIYIGNVAGYLLMSYYFAHLKIQYGVTPLREGVVQDFEYTTPTVATNTQCVADLPMVVKKKIYQLAVFCAQVSLYSVDKAIEKMLITEVNDFDKKKEQGILANLLRYGG